MKHQVSFVAIYFTANYSVKFIYGDYSQEPYQNIFDFYFRNSFIFNKVANKLQFFLVKALFGAYTLFRIGK